MLGCGEYGDEPIAEVLALKLVTLPVLANSLLIGCGEYGDEPISEGPES